MAYSKSMVFVVVNEEETILYTIQGIQGPPGFQGSRGSVTVVQGSQGSTGFVGLQGPIGPQGFASIYTGNASQGAQGPIGYQGVMGPLGEVGIDGENGLEGTSIVEVEVIPMPGAIGPLGFEGLEGDRQASLQGYQGERGYQGGRVVSVIAAPRGPQGKIGIVGSSGPPGTITDSNAFIMATGVRDAVATKSDIALRWTTLSNSNISNSNGVFTLTKPGVYTVTFTVTFGPIPVFPNLEDSERYVYAIVDGTILGRMYIGYSYLVVRPNYRSACVSSTFSTYLNPNSTMEFHVYNGSMYSNSVNSTPLPSIGGSLLLSYLSIKLLY